MCDTMMISVPFYFSIVLFLLSKTWTWPSAYKLHFPLFYTCNVLLCRSWAKDEKKYPAKKKIFLWSLLLLTTNYAAYLLHSYVTCTKAWRYLCRSSALLSMYYVTYRWWCTHVFILLMKVRLNEWMTRTHARNIFFLVNWKKRVYFTLKK